MISPNCNALNAVDLVSNVPLLIKTMLFALAVLVVPPTFLYLSYNAKVRKILKGINSTHEDVQVYRVDEVSEDPYIKCLELDPEFVKAHADERKIISMGQYLSQLRYTGDDATTEIFLKKELRATFGQLLMSMFGNTYGAVLLPMLLGRGSSVDGYLGGVANRLSGWITNKVVENNQQLRSDPEGNERAVALGQEKEIAMFPLSISEIIYLMGINQTLIGGGKLSHPPLEMLENGEVTGLYGSSFEGLISSPFDVERDFHATVDKLEDIIRETNPDYDPTDKSVPEPVPVNPRILPDLYMGGGKCEMSHTAREALECRLCAILMNKLSFNYYKLTHGRDDLFVLHSNGETCTSPDQFIQTLLDTGHTLDVCPRCQVTSFGVKFCVKEKDGSWTNVPMGIMLKTGFERYKDNRPVTFAAPHGGMDYYISGPLIGKTNSCAMQFYVAYQGLCAFHADHDARLPWSQKATLSEPYSNEKAVRAARMASLISVACSTIATEMDLPFGGYALLGVCNDLSGMIDHGVNGQTMAYPLTSAGRYVGHFIRCLTVMQEKLKEQEGVELAISDIDTLVHSLANMGNDLHTSPAKAKDTIARFKRSHAAFFFQENAKSYDVLNEIVANFDKMHIYDKEEAAVATNGAKGAKWGRRR